MSVLDLLKPAPKMSQTARILNLLKANGEATNGQLNKICFRYGARIHDLRADTPLKALLKLVIALEEAGDVS